MQASRPAEFWALFTVVISAALVTLGISLATSSLSLVVVAAFVVFAVLLELSPTQINPEVKATLTVIVLFVSIAYGGLPLAVIVSAVAGALSGFHALSDRLVKGAYNTGMQVLGGAAAAWVFSAVVGLALIRPVSDAAAASPFRLTLGLLLSGVAYSLVNAILLAGVVSTTSAVPFLHTAGQFLSQILRLQFLYVGLAAIAYVLLVEVGALALVLMTVPLIVARLSLLTLQQRQEAFDNMVRAFVKAIEVKDGYTRGHAERVADLSVMVAEHMGLSYEERQLIRYGAILHDVGKIGVSLGILCKAGPLTDDEFDEMKTHPDVGAEMLRDIDFLKPALGVIRHHHERLDGRGYPDGLEGTEIPLLTRVVTAVDAFDAMTSTRSYRRALPVEVALAELEANVDTQFDAVVVASLVEVVNEHGWAITDEPVALAHNHGELSIDDIPMVAS